jgi:hypothetical protein
MKFNKLDINSIPYKSTNEKPKTDTEIALITDHILLNIEYFFNILINRAMKVNFNNRDFKLRIISIILLEFSVDLDSNFLYLLIISCFVNLFKFIIVLYYLI